MNLKDKSTNELIDESNLIDKVLIVLQSSDKPLSPSEISFRVGFPKPKNTAKTVNPTLYKLLKDDKVIKTSTENGSKPLWSIKT